MRIQILSDLHTEFSLFTPPKDIVSDVVVLAGDIGNGVEGMTWARETFPEKEHIFYVIGNHELYHHDFDLMTDTLEEAAERHKVHLLNRDVVDVGDVRFIGCTLWTDFKLYYDQSRAMEAAENCMNDYRLIRRKGLSPTILTPDDTIKEFNRARNFLEEEFNSKTIRGKRKVVVVTHHGPSALSVAPQFVNDPLTPAFTSHLDDHVRNADLWIHGHTHASFDYSIGKCRVVANPRGYSYYKDLHPENPQFDPRKVVEI